MMRNLTLTIAAVLSGSFAFAQVATVKTNLPAAAAPGSTHKVELTVSKPGITGFAKLQQELPSGFNATAVETANSTFSFKDKKVKYLWMALPNGDEFTVSYNLTIDPSVSGTQVFDGAFSYIKDNETQKFSFQEIIKVEVGATQPEQEVTTVDPATEKPVVKDEPKKEEPVADNSQAEADAKKAEEAAAKKAKEEAEKAKAAADKKAAEEAKRKKEEEERMKAEAKKETPKKVETAKSANSGSGVIYRVQIAATHNANSTANDFASKYSISDQVYKEDHEGWIKFTVGEFSSYTAAHTFRSSLRDNNGCEGAFVTAYNNGTRISTREALDLQGQ